MSKCYQLRVVYPVKLSSKNKNPCKDVGDERIHTNRTLLKQLPREVLQGRENDPTRKAWDVRRDGGPWKWSRFR